jgi:hypothetical protein
VAESLKKGRIYMTSIRSVAILCAAAFAAGCASTTVTQRQRYEGAQLPKPERIRVYNFAASQADVPSWAAGASRYTGQEPAQSAEQLAAGRKLGDQVAKELVAEIRAMGLPAEQAGPLTPLQVGDYALVGYFESVDEGSAVERVALGFGAGAASMKTRVEGYQMTATGARKLGGGEVDSGGGKGPGLAVPLAVTIATANPIGLVVGGAVKVGTEVSGHDTIEGVSKRTAKEIGEQLREAFQRQGWI